MGNMDVSCENVVARITEIYTKQIQEIMEKKMKCIPYNEQTKHLLGTTDNWEE